MIRLAGCRSLVLTRCYVAHLEGEMPTLDPVVHRRRLGHRLRDLRKGSGKSQEDVMRELGWSRSRINRIENGIQGITTESLGRLLEFYGVTDEVEIESLMDAARSTRKQSSWGRFQRLVSPEFYAFLAHEESASSVRSYQPLTVPGVLQSPEYAAVVTGWGGRRDRAEVREMVELRARRQDILSREGLDGHIPFSFLLHEAAISLVVGDRDVMRGQLRHLIDVARAPNIRLRVVPFEFGIFSHWRQPHVLLEVGDPRVDDAADVILYLENPGAEVLISQSGRSDRGTTGAVRPDPLVWLSDYTDLENELGGPDETIALLEAAIGRLSRPRPDGSDVPRAS
ncbi:Scr1 family TA system antitoxin-like transcriptional regulator [Cryptosporangium phraense]|uniref:Helix-turn-helix transcriptional regulator n=1 Tax=Cryptosporangium phraense TaxID=2593070 RepID=A0A545AUR0_9ACTN|nr:Scr1 family TA system antitoxin-like transcriptional regulator [Cryptosporangium phraense]TQS45043.1 helix-turn-helix transcriptional regulator [Cryptosporangium phraense]